MSEGLQSRNDGDTSQPSTAQNYFQEPNSTGILYGHIGLMLLAWLGCFPLCRYIAPSSLLVRELTFLVITFEFVQSNLTYLFQVLFLGLNAIGTALGIVYKSRTPNLYPGNIHHAISWTMTVIATSQLVVRLLRSCVYYKSERHIPVVASHEEQPLVSSSGPWNSSDQHLDEDLRVRPTSNQHRASYLSGERKDVNGSSFRRMHQFLLRLYRDVSRGRYHETSDWNKGCLKFIESLTVDWITNKTSKMFSVVLTALTFVNICSGIVTMAGIFVSPVSS